MTQLVHMSFVVLKYFSLLRVHYTHLEPYHHLQHHPSFLAVLSLKGYVSFIIDDIPFKYI